MSCPNCGKPSVSNTYLFCRECVEMANIRIEEEHHTEVMRMQAEVARLEAEIARLEMKKSMDGDGFTAREENQNAEGGQVMSGQDTRGSGFRIELGKSYEEIIREAEKKPEETKKLKRAIKRIVSILIAIPVVSVVIVLFLVLAILLILISPILYITFGCCGYKKGIDFLNDFWLNDSKEKGKRK